MEKIGFDKLLLKIIQVIMNHNLIKNSVHVLRHRSTRFLVYFSIYVATHQSILCGNTR